MPEIPEISAGDTAWVLVATALVLLMTPGLAFFYGGMVRMKSVLNMMMMSFGAMGLVAILWVLYGYSMAFGNDVGYGLLGSPTEFFGLAGITADSISGAIPTFVFVMFQAMFAIITVALISGAIADRTKFGAWMVFAGIWATVVYFPVAHWVFAFDSDGVTGGWIANNLGLSTLQVEPRFTSTQVQLAWHWHSYSASASASARRRSVRTTCRS